MDGVSNVPSNPHSRGGLARTRAGIRLGRIVCNLPIQGLLDGNAMVFVVMNRGAGPRKIPSVGEARLMRCSAARCALQSNSRAFVARMNRGNGRTRPDAPNVSTNLKAPEAARMHAVRIVQAACREICLPKGVGEHEAGKLPRPLVVGSATVPEAAERLLSTVVTSNAGRDRHGRLATSAKRIATADLRPVLAQDVATAINGSRDEVGINLLFSPT